MSTLAKSPFFQFVLSGIRPFFREPEALGWAFAFPLLVTLCMALAFGGEAKNEMILIGIVDAPHLDASWLAAIEGDKGIKAIRLEGSVTRDVFLRDRLDAIVTPDGIVSTSGGGSDDPFVTKLLAVREVLNGPKVSVTKAEVKGIRWIEWFIPGMIGLQMLSRGLFGVALHLAQDRSRGYLKRLRLSPFRKSDYLLGFGVGRATIVVIEVMALLLIFRIAYHFQIQGSFALFMAVAMLGALSCSLLGIALTSRMVNHEAANGLCSAVFFPLMFISGVYFKSEKFPVWAQNIVHALPLGALNEALRLVANAGASPTEIVRPLLVLLAWGAFALVIALRFFKWDPRET
jgi:ABC-2 type transport system permease protein